MGKTTKSAAQYEAASARFREKMRRLGITDARFARICRLHGRTVRGWAAGEREFGGPAEALADLLLERPELLQLLPE